MSTELVATGGPGALQGIAIDQEAILRTLNLNPRDPNVQALVLVCQQYGLDPVLKHAVLIKGNLYVTRDGLLHVAHQSGRLDGIVVEDEGENPQEWWAKVSVFVKGQSHPYSYRGRYPKSGSQTRYGPEMAVKTAEVMALRRAFGVTGLPTVEEQWDKSDEIAAGAADGLTGDGGRGTPARATSAAPPEPDPEPRVESFIPPDDAPDASGHGPLPGWLKGLHARMGEVFPTAKKAEMDEYRRLLVRHVSGETKSSRDLTPEEREAFDEILTQIAEGSWHFASRVPEGWELRRGAGPQGEVLQPELVGAAEAPDLTGPEKNKVLRRARQLAEERGEDSPAAYDEIPVALRDEAMGVLA